MKQSPFLLSLTLFLIAPFIVSQPACANDDTAHLSLHDAFKHAYNSNPSLMAARTELDITQELYPQARSGWRPSLSAETSLYSSDVDSSNFGSADGATTKDISVNLTQPIWRGGRTFAETARARSLINVGEATLQQEEQDLFLRTATAYLNVIRDRKLLRLRIENEHLLSEELQASEERRIIGDITMTDVHQARTRLSRAKSDRIQAAADYDISRAEFTEIVGLYPVDTLITPTPEFKFPDTLDDMFTLAEKHNPEILIANFHHKASEHYTNATFRELLPQVSAFASFNKQYDPQPGLVDQSRTDTIGLRATLSLYEGGATRSRVREAKQSQKRREYQIQEITRSIKQDITSNWRSYLAAKQQAQSRQVEVESATIAREGVKIEASGGQRSVLDILDADQEVIVAQAALLNAQRNEALTQYALASSLGLLNAHALHIHKDH